MPLPKKIDGTSEFAENWNLIIDAIAAVPEFIESEPPIEITHGPGGTAIRLTREVRFMKVELSEDMWGEEEKVVKVRPLEFSEESGEWSRSSEEEDEIEVYCDFFRGFLFETERLTIELDQTSGRWHPVGGGHVFFKGDSAEQELSPDGEADFELPNGFTASVTALDRIRVNKAYAVWWDDERKRWYGSGIC